MYPHWPQGEAALLWSVQYVGEKTAAPHGRRHEGLRGGVCHKGFHLEGEGSQAPQEPPPPHG